MRKRIITYSNHIDELLKSDMPKAEWENVMEEHLIQIGFFQHERLIHLLVTITFAIGAFLSIICAAIVTKWMLLASVLIFVLLFPYINHYFLLERRVQKMYEQYDQILNKCKDSQPIK